MPGGVRHDEGSLRTAAGSVQARGEAVSEPRLVPLGDQAVLAYCRDEATALRLAARVRRARPPWLVDVVQAYTSVADYYDLDRTDFAAAAEVVRALAQEADDAPAEATGTVHLIPCCYEL